MLNFKPSKCAWFVGHACSEKDNLEHSYSSNHTKLDELQGQMHFYKVSTLQWSLPNKQFSINCRQFLRDSVMHLCFVVSLLIAKKLNAHLVGVPCCHCGAASTGQNVEEPSQSRLVMW